MPKVNRQEFTAQSLGGVDRSVNQTKLPFGDTTSFTTLQNLVPDKRFSLRRINGSSLFTPATGGGTKILLLHLFSVGDESLATSQQLAIMTRAGNTDALYQNSGLGNWIFKGALPGTNLYYNVVQWRNKLFILDGTNTPRVYDGTSISVLTGTNIPTSPACGAIHQERLFLGGGPALPDRVVFSNVIDETTFLANSFYNFLVGRNETIRAIAINSVTTSESGAQAQLAIFKPNAVGIVNGIVGSGQETLSVLSSTIGTQASHTLVNTPFGLIFMGNYSVYLLGTNGREPTDIGYKLGTAIRDIPYASKSKAVAVYQPSVDGPFYRLAIPDSTGVDNVTEWMLGLHDSVFARLLWYGPHTGDTISAYVRQDTVIYASKAGTATLYQLDDPLSVVSMTDTVNPRVIEMEWPTILLPDYKAMLIDAVGVVANIEPTDQLSFTTESSGVVFNANLFAAAAQIDDSMDWDIDNWDDVSWAGARISTISARPHTRGTDCRTVINYTASNQVIFHNIYVRVKPTGRSMETV